MFNSAYHPLWYGTPDRPEGGPRVTETRGIKGAAVGGATEVIEDRGRRLVPRIQITSSSKSSKALSRLDRGTAVHELLHSINTPPLARNEILDSATQEAEDCLVLQMHAPHYCDTMYNSTDIASQMRALYALDLSTYSNIKKERGKIRALVDVLSGLAPAPTPIAPDELSALQDYVNQWIALAISVHHSALCYQSNTPPRGGSAWSASAARVRSKVEHVIHNAFGPIARAIIATSERIHSDMRGASCAMLSAFVGPKAPRTKEKRAELRNKILVALRQRYARWIRSLYFGLSEEDKKRSGNRSCERGLPRGLRSKDLSGTKESRMNIIELPRDRPCAVRLNNSDGRIRRRVPSHSGAILRVGRLAQIAAGDVSMPAFLRNEVRSVTKRRPPVAILIDASGSMHIDHATLRRIVELSPKSVCAYYYGMDDNEDEPYACGDLVIYARGGMRASELPEQKGAGNEIDLHAVRWLLAHPGDVVLVSDLVFCGGARHEEYQLALDLVVAARERGKLTVLPSADALIEYLGGK